MPTAAQPNVAFRVEADNATASRRRPFCSVAAGLCYVVWGSASLAEVLTSPAMRWVGGDVACLAELATENVDVKLKLIPFPVKPRAPSWRWQRPVKGWTRAKRPMIHFGGQMSWLSGGSQSPGPLKAASSFHRWQEYLTTAWPRIRVCRGNVGFAKASLGSRSVLEYTNCGSKHHCGQVVTSVVSQSGGGWLQRRSGCLVMERIKYGVLRRPCVQKS